MGILFKIIPFQTVLCSDFESLDALKSNIHGFINYSDLSRSKSSKENWTLTLTGTSALDLGCGRCVNALLGFHVFSICGENMEPFPDGWMLLTLHLLLFLIFCFWHRHNVFFVFWIAYFMLTDRFHLSNFIFLKVSYQSGMPAASEIELRFPSVWLIPFFEEDLVDFLYIFPLKNMKKYK